MWKTQPSDKGFQEPRQSQDMNIHFGATDIVFYSKGDDVNKSIYNIKIEEPTLKRKKHSNQSLLSEIEEEFEYLEEVSSAIACLRCMKGVTLTAIRCTIM